MRQEEKQAPLYMIKLKQSDETKNNVGRMGGRRRGCFCLN